MQNNNISPHIYALMAVGTALFAFLGFRIYGQLDEWFFLPIIGLAFLWGVANFVRQRGGKSTYYIDSRIGLTRLMKRALLRYLVWMAVFYAGLSFFHTHSYYGGYGKSLHFLDRLFDLYLLAGLPYFMTTLVFKASQVEDFYDPAVRIAHMLKQVVWRLLHRRDKVFDVFRNQYNRKVLLNLLMRAYFIPPMVVQIYFNLNNALSYSNNGFQNYSFTAILFWLSAMLWLMDALNASVAYSIESRWTENRSRSIDMTAGGWLVCLACYAPLNNVTGTLFPFGPSVAEMAPGTFMFDGSIALYIFKMMEIIVLSAVVYADLSLGPSVANITLKRLQTRGPYAVVRHPGTVCKLALWWLQTATYAQFWASPQLIFGHLAWNVIYILRALTEERHLSHFQEYRDYQKKVKYRFIPGVI